MLAGSPARRGAISTLKSTPETRLTISHDFEHRKAVAVAAIQRLGLSARAQVAKRIRMRADKIAHVNVVADTRAVGRRIVGTKNFDLGAET